MTAVEELKAKRAAQMLRKNQKLSRRWVQKGGVIYASEARLIVRQRKENEVKKAKDVIARAIEKG